MATVTEYDAVDLFAGAGGWDVAARELGLSVLGIENNEAACATRRAAGLTMYQGSVTDCSPDDFPAAGLIASPPCQTFSLAGKGAGREQLGRVIEGVTSLAYGLDTQGFTDPRTALVLEPLRWALSALHDGAPYRWLAFEQVPAVLPVWEAMADVLRQAGYGYAAATGLVYAEQYGVPQTRKRAILLARLEGSVDLPAPTHRRYRKGTLQDAGDQALRPWVSMADALGWGATQRPSWTLCAPTGGGRTPIDGGAHTRAAMATAQEYGNWVMRSNYGTGGDPANRGERQPREPAPSVTGKFDRNTWVMKPNNQSRASVRSANEPAATVTAGKDYNEREWVLRNNSSAHAAVRALSEPSPTLYFSKRANFCEWQRPPERVKVTEGEAACLQTFPDGFPWQGTKGQRFQQIGNAVPPLLARMLLGKVLDTHVPRG